MGPMPTLRVGKCPHLSPSASGLGLQILSLATRVRIPLGMRSPFGGDRGPSESPTYALGVTVAQELPTLLAWVRFLQGMLKVDVDGSNR